MFKIFREGVGSPELKKKETKVILEFMRHGEKDPNKTEPTKTDEEVRLTEKGRKMAQDKGKELNPQSEVSLGWRSPKKRTGETVLHAMLPEISENASLEEMEEIIGKELKVGRKLVEDSRLSFDLSGPEGKEMLQAFKEGKYLPFLIENSDQRAIETGDKTSSTYSRYAGDIAEIINRYTKVGDNFNKIASKTDKYEKFGDRLERYLGSHQGVVEGFVAKVLEKTQGAEKRDEFIKSVGGGFKETEGIHVEINNKGNEQEISITYGLNGNRETVKIDKELLEEIIKDKKVFEEKVNRQTEKEADKETLINFINSREDNGGLIEIVKKTGLYVLDTGGMDYGYSSDEDIKKALIEEIVKENNQDRLKEWVSKLEIVY